MSKFTCFKANEMHARITTGSSGATFRRQHPSRYPQTLPMRLEATIGTTVKRTGPIIDSQYMAALLDDVRATWHVLPKCLPTSMRINVLQGFSLLGHSPDHQPAVESSGI